MWSGLMQRTIGTRLIATLSAGLLVLAASDASRAQSPASGPNAFMFVAMGDMPYRIPDDYPKVDRLIATINKARPAFVLHVGDIKSGSVPCSDEVLRKSFDQMQTIAQPLVYSVGDNEWTDCHRERAGKFDPRERLAKVREMFFPKPGQSLGKAPMPVDSQALLDPKHKPYVENQRFARNGVVFIVPHVVGSNNGFEAQDPKAIDEFFARNAANIAWIDDGFRVARESGAKAVVLAFQANLYDIKQKYPEVPRASGYIEIIRAIERGANALGKPVLVVTGDEHELELEAFRDTSFKIVPNTFRLQVPGAERVHAVRVLVDPDDPAVFGIMPLVVPENGPL
jgi:hypothetical protein